MADGTVQEDNQKKKKDKEEEEEEEAKGRIGGVGGLVHVRPV